MDILWNTLSELDNTKLSELLTILNYPEKELQELTENQKRQEVFKKLFEYSKLQPHLGNHALQMACLQSTIERLELHTVDIQKDSPEEIVDEIYTHTIEMMNEHLNSMDQEEQQEFAKSMAEYSKKGELSITSEAEKILHEIQKGKETGFNFLTQSTSGVKSLIENSKHFFAGALSGTLWLLGPIGFLLSFPVAGAINWKLADTFYKNLRIVAATVFLIVETKYLEELKLQQRYLPYLDALQAEAEGYKNKLSVLRKLIDHLDSPAHQVASESWYEEAIRLLPEERSQ